MPDQHTSPIPPPWPPPWARSVAFMTGIALTCWETVADKAEHIVVYGPAFALTGLPLARGVETLLSKMPWNSSTHPPPPSPPAPMPTKAEQEESG